MAARCITLLACPKPIVLIFRSPMNWVNVPNTGSTVLWRLPFIFFTVVRNAELLLLGAFPETLASYRTVDTDMLACTVLLLFGLDPTVQELFGERYGFSLRTGVTVAFPVINEIIRASLVGAVGRYEAL